VTFDGQSAPAARSGQPEPELVEGAGDDVVDDVVEILGVVVEGRRRRQDRHAHAGQRQQVLQVDGGQRGLPGDQDELAALFESHIRRPADEILCEAGADTRDRLHAARDDRHAVGGEGTAGDGRSLILRSVVDDGQRCHLRHGAVGLQSDGRAGPPAHHEMRLHLHVAQRLQQPDADDSPGGSGHGYDESHERAFQ
jgi:hypothetical protein